MDSEAVLRHLFTRVPGELFHSPTLAFEFVRFCGDSLPLFGRNLDILKQSFPNLFKARSVVLGPVGGGGYSAPCSCSRLAPVASLQGAAWDAGRGPWDSLGGPCFL